VEQSSEALAHRYGLALKSGGALVLSDPTSALELYRVAVQVLATSLEAMRASRDRLTQELRQAGLLTATSDGGRQILEQGLQALAPEIARMQGVTSRWPQAREETHHG
jgi:hypothetical protein